MTLVDYSAKIIADSVNPAGDRLTTFELTYPRFVHAELMTHRMFSRNSASSRAIPTPKLMRRIADYPVLPKWWGKNQKGMQAREELAGTELEQVQRVWLEARDSALSFAGRLRELGLHKQIANRIVEPWMFITVIVTATEFENWFYQRDSEYAQPEIAWVAREMRAIYDANEPEKLEAGQWHLPYVEPSWGDENHPLFVSYDDFSRYGDGCDGDGWLFMAQISTARCARVSYLTHDGIRNLSEDLKLHGKLSESGHWSPFEHPAEALPESTRCGNLIGWRQYRKMFENEHHGRKLI